MQRHETSEHAGQAIQMHWDEVLSPADWDREFPGMLDGIGLLAGTANVIMQLAHPAVGHGVRESRVESGSVMKHPIKRTRTTLTYLAVSLTGSTEEKLAYRRAVSRVHAQVTSTEDSPVKYRALDPELQKWVAACLFKGYVDGYQRLRGGLSREQLARFYQLSTSLGTTLQVRPDTWPATLEAFETYWQEGLSRTCIDDTIRRFLMVLVEMRVLPWPIRWIFAPWHRLATTAFLPPELRVQMQLPWSEADERRAQRYFAVVGGINRLLPRVIRQLPFLYCLRDFRWRLRSGRSLV